MSSRTPSSMFRRAALIATAVYIVFIFSFAGKASAWPRGGNGGGGNSGGGTTTLDNPAYVIVDADNINRLKLLSVDGLQEQEIHRGKAFHPMAAPAFSPDLQWIAYIQLEDYGRSLRLIHPDGSGQRTVYAFTGGDFVDQVPGMQWVPGEVDRIVYSANTSGSIYSISTQAESPVPKLILENFWWLGGATLSPDLAPDVLGYQGAMAYVGPGVMGDGTVFPNLLSVVFVADGDNGLELDLSSLVQATTLTDGVSTPVWSHDGLEIAFLYRNTTYPDPGNSIEVIPVSTDEMGITLDEDNVRTVYDTSLVDVYTEHSVIHRPSWSPDDSLIGFIATLGIATSGGRTCDLFVAATDGSGAVNVTQGSRHPFYMDWNPGFDVGQ